MFKNDPFKKSMELTTQVTGGVCPVCTDETMFVSLNPAIFRCVSCGSDCKQHINGRTRYLPILSKSPEENSGQDTKVRG